MIYAICDGRGQLLANIVFRDPDLAKRWFEATSEEQWNAMADADGTPRAGVPTLEWRRIDAPEWASDSGEAWIGLVGGTPEDPGAQPHIAALEYEDR